MGEAYDRDGIRITGADVAIGDQRTYRLADIESVRIVSSAPQRIGSILCVVAGLPLLAAGYYILGGFALAAGAATLLGLKPRYMVAITSTDGDMERFEFPSRGAAERATVAIHAALGG